MIRLQKIVDKNNRMQDKFAKMYSKQLIDVLPVILEFVSRNKAKRGLLAQIPITNALIKQMLARAGLPLWFQFADHVSGVANEAIKDLGETLDDVGTTVLFEPSKKAFIKAHTIILDDMALESARIESTLIRSVKTQLQQMQVVPISMKEASLVLANAQGIAKHQAKTLLNTGLAGIQREIHLETGQLLQKQGFDVVYTYQGANDSVTRPFCKSIVGKTFTARQIGQMKNKDGSNVFKYGGGFNCRHRWIATTKESAEDRGLTIGGRSDITTANRG